MKPGDTANRLAARVEAFRDEEVRRFVDLCQACGECVLVCPTVPLTEAGDWEPTDLQQKVRDFLAGEGPADAAVHARAFACLECVACITDVCPEELDPMAVNQAVMGRWPEPPPKAVGPPMSRSVRVQAPTVLFTGCNIYHQADLVANLTGIMESATGGDWALLPGGELCCGNDRLVVGDIAGMAAKLEGLIDALIDTKAETVVVWCTACLLVFRTLVEPVIEPPFRIQSFTGYLAGRLDGLEWKKPIDEDITLHEPCRSGHQGWDATAARDILSAVPGVNVVDMPRHGKEASCCGNNAMKRGFAAGAQIRDGRYAEAGATGATTLATVCHRCHQVLSDVQADDGPAVRNILSIVAEALD